MWKSWTKWAQNAAHDEAALYEGNNGGNLPKGYNLGQRALPLSGSGGSGCPGSP